MVSDYPPELEAIVMHGLARDREERYATAEELQLALEAFARERRLPVSPVPLGRFVRELFKSELDAWHAAERAGQPGEPVVQTTPSGNLLRTETSLSGPMPPLGAGHTDPSLSVPVDLSPPRHRRGAIAVVLGVIAGSLITWLLVRPASVPVPAILTPTAAASTAAVSHAADNELPAPAAPAPVAATPPTASSPRSANSAAVTSAAKAPGGPTPKRAPVRKLAKRPPPKKLPPGWDPESLLPP